MTTGLTLQPGLENTSHQEAFLRFPCLLRGSPKPPLAKAEGRHGPGESKQFPTFLFSAGSGYLLAPFPAVLDNCRLFRTSLGWYIALFRRMWELTSHLQQNHSLFHASLEQPPKATSTEHDREPPSGKTHSSTGTGPFPGLSAFPFHLTMSWLQDRPDAWTHAAQVSDPVVAGSGDGCGSELGAGGLESAPASLVTVTRACLSGEHYEDVAKLVRQELGFSRPRGQRE